MVFSLSHDIPFTTGTTYTCSPSSATIEPELFVVAYLDGQELPFNAYNENVPPLTFPNAVANSRIRFSELPTAIWKVLFSERSIMLKTAVCPLRTGSLN